MIKPIIGYVLVNNGLPIQEMIITINTDHVEDVEDYKDNKSIISLKDGAKVVTNGDSDSVKEILGL